VVRVRESFFTGLLYNIRDCKGVEEKEEEKLKKIKNNEQKI